MSCLKQEFIKSVARLEVIHTCMPTPCCLANASFSLFCSKRTTFAFRQRGLSESGPNPGSTKIEKSYGCIAILPVFKSFSH